MVDIGMLGCKYTRTELMNLRIDKVLKIYEFVKKRFPETTPHF